MRHQIVTRVVVTFVVVLAAAVGAFTWLTTRPAVSAARPSAAASAEAPALPSGADLFARHCAMCHDAGDTGLPFRQDEDADGAASRFRTLLEDHYAPTPEAAAAIVDHVMALPVP